ncbi:hypothetical protein CYMTET_46184, partial [Cymbomonas tetramitiformis]
LQESHVCRAVGWCAQGVLQESHRDFTACLSNTSSFVRGKAAEVVAHLLSSDAIINFLAASHVVSLL